MNAWASITPLVLAINAGDVFGQFAIFSLPHAGRALHPSVETTYRDREHTAENTHFKWLAVLFNKAKTGFYGCEKMASAFLGKSPHRSERNRVTKLLQATYMVALDLLGIQPIKIILSQLLIWLLLF